jgi:diguanylate cyclase (GGDEF)-like protein
MFGPIPSFPCAVVEIWGLTLVALPTTAALAAVALIGYIFGTRTRSRAESMNDGRRQRELERAATIAWQLESIAERLRQDLASHHAQVELFKNRLRRAQADGSERSWKELCEMAESVLGPTMQMAQQLSLAYDEIRQQSDALETFAQGRTDPLTGVGNGRALESKLQVLLTTPGGKPLEFVAAIVSLDRIQNLTGESGGLSQVLLLPKLASVIRTCMRDADFVARFGDDEFVVVMPNTNLNGATVFADRLRHRIVQELGQTTCCGMAAATLGDDCKSLLARADSALYSAKASGRNRLFFHTGSQIREHRATSANTVDRQTTSPRVHRSSGKESQQPSPFGECSPMPVAGDEMDRMTSSPMERD